MIGSGRGKDTFERQKRSMFGDTTCWLISQFSNFKQLNELYEIFAMAAWVWVSLDEVIWKTIHKEISWTVEYFVEWVESEFSSVIFVNLLLYTPVEF